MKLAEILPEIEKGRRFRRKDWEDGQWWTKNNMPLLYTHDFFADDWELEPEPENRELWAIELDKLRVDEKGEIHFYFGTKPPQPQRRSLAYAIRNLLKEFEGETE